MWRAHRMGRGRMAVFEAFVQPQLVFQDRISGYYRAWCTERSRNVILKVLTRERSSEAELEMYKKEFATLRGLDHPGIIKALDLNQTSLGLTLFLEDIGGEQLKGIYESITPSRESLLAWFLDLSRILSHCHECGVTHGNITPYYIIVNRHTGQVQLAGFHNDLHLAGDEGRSDVRHLLMSMAYKAPESHTVGGGVPDRQSDLYSLGVVMYEAFTGRLPFEVDTVGGMIHAQVAITPPPPSSICVDIPPWLDEIIVTLMNRNPVGRFVSAGALAEALESGMRNGESSVRHPIRGLVAHGDGILCGREEEKRALADWIRGISEAGAVPFERPGVMILSGTSGSGKTALAEWACRYARQKHPDVILATGKFDQNVEMPGSAFVSALQQVVRTLLGEPEGKLREWRRVVKRLMGQGGSLLSAMVPDFSLLSGVGPDERPLDLDPSAKANVYRMTMINFFRVFKQMGRPLILFIDDLQWADEDSMLFLNLLTEISGEKVGLLAAMRSRESEGDGGDELFDTATLKRDGKVDVMPVQGLDSLAVETFLALTLREERKRIAPLAELFYAKTGGNPYQLNAFLEKVLHGGELVRAHGPQGEGWHWNQQKLEALPICNSAAQWVSERVERLDTQMLQLVEAASLLGHKVVPELLSMVVQRPEEKVRQGLEALCDENIFVRAESGYRFAHDLVQAAAYARMNRAQREVAHFSAGMHLYEGLKRQPGPYLFDVVCQFNASGEIPMRESYRMELVQLNLTAGKRAMETSSFGQALDCFRSGLRFLGEGGWMADYALALEVTSAAAEAAFALGEYDAMEGYVAAVERAARDEWDCVGVWRMRIRGAIAVNDLSGALVLGREALGRFGFRLPETVTRGHQVMAFLRIRRALFRVGPGGIDRMPAMTDAGHLSIMELLFTVIMAAYLAGSDLSTLIIFKALRYSLRRGRSKYTPFLLASYGFICIRVNNDVEMGMGQVRSALALMEKGEHPGVRGKIQVLTVCLIRHWKEPIHTLLPQYLKAYEQSLAEGDSEYAGSAVSAWFYSRFFASGDLHQLARDMVVYRQEMERLRLPFIGTVRNLQQAVANLIEGGAHPVEFSGPFFTEGDQPFEGALPNDHIAGLNYHITKGFLAFLFGDDALALHHVERYSEMIDEGTSTFTIPVFSAVAASVFARWGGQGTSSKHKRWVKQAKRIEKELWRASVSAPYNFSHLHEMVLGELFLAEKNLSKAVRHFEAAGEKAKKHNFIFHEAYAAERAGFCYLKRGRKRLARVCLTDAVNLWRFWGAEAKAQKLEKEFEEVLWRLSPMEAEETNGLLGGHGEGGPRTGAALLDLEGLSRAFEAISSERTFDGLVEKLVLTALEYGGAEVGAVCRMDGGQVTLEAQKARGSSDVERCGSVPLTGSAHLPAVMIHYVARTGAVLHHTHGDALVVHDPYFDDFQHGSAICIPSTVHSQLCGVLYLENRTVDHLFSGRRLRVLKILASQMAIAMENTRLYENLKDQAEKLQMVNRVLKNEIEDRRGKEAALLDKERELHESGEKLKVANTTLTQMLSKSDENMAEIQENMMRNVQDLIVPYLERLKGTRLTQLQVNLSEMLEQNINDILSPFARKLDAGFFRLTPAEIQTAQLVRSGKTTKEIADLLNLSPRTIDAYRDSIREKLGLKKSGVNLRVYLMDM